MHFCSNPRLPFRPGHRQDDWGRRLLTKRRPPVSVDAALARIAGQLEHGWADMACATSRTEGIVRAWGDPARREKIPVEDAIMLDLAYRDAGGEGAPIFEAYGAQLDIEGGEWFADQIALGRYAAELVRECGEAEIAVILAAQPGSTSAQRSEARREVEQAIALLTRARLMLGTPSPLPAEPRSTGPPP